MSFCFSSLVYSSHCLMICTSCRTSSGSCLRLLQGLRLPRVRNNGKSTSSSANSQMVLGIESSCDDTGAAVVRGDGHILGEALHSQLAVHKMTGGIVPTVAGELHQQNLEKVIQLALTRSGCALEDVSVIAVTTGPGLAPCLKAGLVCAKQLVRIASKPLLSVHHMEAHALTARMESSIPFPYLVLLISGGHCILATVKGVGQFSRLGQTGDDSPGEALDKVSRWLNLEAHPEVADLAGGAAIEKLAERGDPNRFKLPQVMARSRCCNFSFAGLKTAARRHVARVAAETAWSGDSPLPHCEDLCAFFQQAVASHLLTRTHRAILYCKREESGIKDLVVSGGVASNKYLRSNLQTLALGEGFKVHFPSPHLCTDNGAMIAWAGIEYLNSFRFSPENNIVREKAQFGDRLFDVERLNELDFRPKWPLGLDVSHRVKDLDISSRKLSRII